MKKLNELIHQFVGPDKGKIPGDNFWTEFWRLKRKELLITLLCIVGYMIFFWLPASFGVGYWQWKLKITTAKDGVPILSQKMPDRGWYDACKKGSLPRMNPMPMSNAIEHLDTFKTSGMTVQQWIDKYTVGYKDDDNIIHLKAKKPKITAWLLWHWYMVAAYIIIFTIFLILYTWLKINYETVKKKLEPKPEPKKKAPPKTKKK